MSARWTPEEDQVLRDRHRILTAPHLATLLPGRTVGAIYMRIQRLGLSRGVPRTRWTAADRQVLRDLYPGGGVKAVMARLPCRGAAAIRAKAMRLGLPFDCRSRPWTADELRLIESLYPTGGTCAVQARLPHRTRQSIRQRAHEMGVSRILGQAPTPAVHKGARTISHLTAQHSDIARRVAAWPTPAGVDHGH